MRTLLHTVFHSFLVNLESRNSMLMYISKILKSNERRVQFAADEKSLARDGFMLNLMVVLQQLSVKIRLNRVDPLYPFHWESLVVIAKDTKLRFGQEEYTEWLDKLREYRLFIVIKSACFLCSYNFVDPGGSRRGSRDGALDQQFVTFNSGSWGLNLFLQSRTELGKILINAFNGNYN